MCFGDFFVNKSLFASTKVAPIWSPHSKLQFNQIEKVQRTAARWTCRRWRNTSSVGEMLDELEWASLQARRDQSSLLLFHKIHCGAVSIEKDKYMTPAHSLKTTRSSHSAQYRRHQTRSKIRPKNGFSVMSIGCLGHMLKSAELACDM